MLRIAGAVANMDESLEGLVSKLMDECKMFCNACIACSKRDNDKTVLDKGCILARQMRYATYMQFFIRKPDMRLQIRCRTN